MAAISCTLLRDGKRTSIRMANEHTYVAKYRIVTNDPNDGHLTVFATAQTVGPNPLPPKMTPYQLLGDVDLTATVREYDITQRSDKLIWWDAVVTWRKAQSGEPDPPDTVHPLLRPPKYWIEYIRETKPATVDYMNTPVQNPAKQTYPEPIVRTYHRPVLVIKRAYPTLDAIWDLNQTYENTMNSDELLNRPAETWRYAVTRTNEPREEDGIQYYDAQTTIEYRAETWKEKKREEGWKHFNAAGKLVTFIDEDGVPFNEPGNLATNGRRLTDGIPANIREWQLDTKVPYTPLIT